MCSCAFYPLHLVYSGLIWTFGVRVNYISYKLFLHFLHSHVLNLRVLSFGKTLARNRVWPLEIKPNEILRSPRSRNINFSPIVVHRTPAHLTTHVQHVHAAHMHGYSVIPGNHLRIIKKEMSLSQANVHCEFIWILQHLWTFLFSPFYYILLAVTMITKQTHGYLILGRLLILYSIILFEKCIKLCTKHSCFLQLCFYLSMLFH